MRTLMKVYVWTMYIIGAPLILLWTIFAIIWGCKISLQYERKLGLKESIGNLLDGFMIGHRSMMESIDRIYGNSSTEEGL